MSGRCSPVMRPLSAVTIVVPRIAAVASVAKLPPDERRYAWRSAATVVVAAAADAVVTVVPRPCGAGRDVIAMRRERSRSAGRAWLGRRAVGSKAEPATTWLPA